MKKGVLIGILIISIVFLSISFVSASWFSDLWGKITGRSVTGNAVSEQGLVAYYQFENNVQDLSGNGNNGLNNGASFVDGRLGRAVSFNGGGDYIEVSEQMNSFNFSNSGWYGSVSAWVKIYDPNPSSDRPIVCRWGSAAWTGWCLEAKSGGQARFSVATRNPNSNDNAYANNVFDDTNWHHIFGVWNKTTVRIYVDGVEGTSDAITGTTYNDGTRPVWIGRNNYDPEAGEYFNGSIDEVKIWDYALTAEEVKAEYESYVKNCTDSDGGLDYYVKGIAIKGSSNTTDFCVDSIQLNEAICNANGNPANAQYSCPNGCSNGACIIAPSETDGCGLLNGTLKSKVAELQAENLTVVLKEGEKVYRYQYVILPRKLLKVYNIVNQTTGYSNDKVTFQDVFSGDNVDATLTAEGEGIVTIGGMVYQVNYYGASDIPQEEKYVILNFPQTSGNIKMTFYCDYPSLIILNDNYRIYPSLVELNKSVQIEESIEVKEADKDLVPSTRQATIIKPSGIKVKIVLTLSEYNKNGYCYDSYDGGSCWFSYQADYTPLIEIGMHVIEESTDPYGGKIMVVEKAYFDNNLVLHLDSAYSVDYSGNYNAYDNLVSLRASYSPNGLNENYNFEVLKYNSLEEAEVTLDDILNDVSGELLSNSQEVQGNVVYIFKHPVYPGTYILWKSGKNIIVAERSPYPQEDENKSIQDFINSLSGISKKEFISLDYYDLPSLLRIITEQYFNLYPSDLAAGQCYSYWECETLPALCPEYGKQTRTCVDKSSCGKPNFIGEIACQPGACSGCMLPQEQYESISKCIPYGFRLNLQGNNSFCDVDGKTYLQRAVQESCQNNHECLSNQCSDGVCVSLVEEIRAQTGILWKIWCKITNLFDDSGYGACLAEHSSAPSSGGGGGGGGSSPA